MIFDTESSARSSLDAWTTQRPVDTAPVVNTAVYELVVEI
jgi:hypothetical protein